MTDHLSLINDDWPTSLLNDIWLAFFNLIILYRDIFPKRYSFYGTGLKYIPKIVIYMFFIIFKLGSFCYIHRTFVLSLLENIWKGLLAFILSSFSFFLQFYRNFSYISDYNPLANNCTEIIFPNLCFLLPSHTFKSIVLGANFLNVI